MDQMAPKDTFHFAERVSCIGVGVELTPETSESMRGTEKRTILPKMMSRRLLSLHIVTLTMGSWIVVARLPRTCFTFWPKGSRVLGSVWNSLDQMVFKDDGLWA